MEKDEIDCENKRFILRTVVISGLAAMATVFAIHYVNDFGFCQSLESALVGGFAAIVITLSVALIPR